jgi:hypothetical protein
MTVGGKAFRIWKVAALAGGVRKGSSAVSTKPASAGGSGVATGSVDGQTHWHPSRKITSLRCNIS